MYEQEAQRKWGNTQEYAQYTQRENTLGRAKMGEYGEELMRLFAQIGQYKHLSVSDETVQRAVQDIQECITAHFYPCSDAVFAQLGEMYVSDERFKASIDQVGGEGCAEFVRRAIALYYR